MFIWLQPLNLALLRGDREDIHISKDKEVEREGEGKVRKEREKDWSRSLIIQQKTPPSSGLLQSHPVIETILLGDNRLVVLQNRKGGRGDEVCICHLQ